MCSDNNFPSCNQRMKQLEQEKNSECLSEYYWISDYKKDIYNTLRETEMKRRLIQFQCKQIVSRPTLLELLKVAAVKHKLGRTTLHLATYFLDCFMDYYTIKHDKLKLIVISFIIIASKMEETDFNTPKFADLNKLAGNKYKLEEFKRIEIVTLELFKFNLLRPTTATFAELLANIVITTDDCYRNAVKRQENMASPFSFNIQYNNNKNNTSKTVSCPITTNYKNTNCLHSEHFNEVRRNFIKAFFQLIDATLMYHNFINIKPSILASSCVAAVRYIHGIHPIWTNHLSDLTDYTIDVLMPFIEAILMIYSFEDKDNRNRASYFCPDSNIILDSSIKDCKAYDNNYLLRSIKLENRRHINEIKVEVDKDDDFYYCLEHPLLTKRRRMC